MVEDMKRSHLKKSLGFHAPFITRPALEVLIDKPFASIEIIDERFPAPERISVTLGQFLEVLVDNAPHFFDRGRLVQAGMRAVDD